MKTTTKRTGAAIQTLSAKRIGNYEILNTIAVSDALKSAHLLGAMLAADKGYSSRIVKIDRHTVDLVASDNRAFRLVQG